MHRSHNTGSDWLLLLAVLLIVLGAIVYFFQGLFPVFIILCVLGFLGLIAAAYFNDEGLGQLSTYCLAIGIAGAFMSFGIGYVFGESHIGQISTAMFDKTANTWQAAQP